jgi:GxxExxY protein
MTHDVIGAAIEVPKDKRPGLLESVYEWCLTMELKLRGHDVRNQDRVVINFRSLQLTEGVSRLIFPGANDP